MKKYICEFIGTMMLTLIACGVAVVSNGNLVATAFAFGFVIIAAAYSVGTISGGHFNPAVSLSMFFTKKINVKDLICYIIAQVAGAFVGSLLLGVLLGSNFSLGANGYGEYYLADTLWIALLIEVILTFIFVMVILIVTNKKEYSNLSGFIIGITLTLIHFIGISFTGTSVNPARSLAPAVLQGGAAFSQVWVFLIAPFLAAILASLFYRYVLIEPKKGEF